VDRRVIVELVEASDKFCLGDGLIELDELTVNASLRREGP
jgi:hypothetical protein